MNGSHADIIKAIIDDAFQRYTVPLWDDIDDISNFVNLSFQGLKNHHENLGYTLEERMAAATIYIEHKIINDVMAVIWSDILPDMSKVVHIDGWFVDELERILGLQVITSDKKISEISSGFITQTKERLQNIERDIKSFQDSVIPEIEKDIENLEFILGGMSDEQIDAIRYILEHSEELVAVIEGNVESIAADVYELLIPDVERLVGDTIKPYDQRITILEEIVMQHEYFFFEWLMGILAQLLAPQLAIEEGLTVAIETIKNWVTTEVTRQIDELKKEIEFGLPAVEEIPQAWIDDLKVRLEITGNGNGGLSAAEVQAIVNAAIAPVNNRINAVETAVSGLVIPTEKQIREWIQEYPPTVHIADYIGAIDVLLAKQITDKITLPEDRISTVASYIIADTISHQLILESTVKPIAEIMTAEMLTSLTDIVEAFGTPEALLSYLVDAPEGQEEPMLDLMQILLTMTFERGLL